MWVWAKPLPFEISLWIEKLLCFLLRSRKPRLMMMVLSLNVPHALLRGRKSNPQIWRPQRTQIWPVVDFCHWTTFLHSESFIVRSKFVAFALALVPVLWHFRWIQKWLQSIQGPCGSFRKFSIKINFTLKPSIPRSPCLDSNPACLHKATKSVISHISSLNDKWAACLLRMALISILQVLKIAFRRGLVYTRA